MGNSKNQTIYKALIPLGIVLVLSLVGNIILIAKIKSNLQISRKNIADMIIQPVLAQEIYPEFICGCCGKLLDPDNICCGDMKQKIDYIDILVEVGLSKDEIMMKATKKFGINALATDEMKSIIKDKLLEAAPDYAPQIVFEQEKINLGIVSQARGIITVTFNFKNDGKEDLIIDKLATSCGCTAAVIVYQGQEGPSFTMPGHGKDNPKDWTVAIAAGDMAQVKVYYDPNTHGPQPEDRQFITRTISIFSNDPVEFAKQLRIELEQTP